MLGTLPAHFRSGASSWAIWNTSRDVHRLQLLPIRTRASGSLKYHILYTWVSLSSSIWKILYVPSGSQTTEVSVWTLKRAQMRQIPVWSETEQAPNLPSSGVYLVVARSARLPHTFLLIRCDFYPSIPVPFCSTSMICTISSFLLNLCHALRLNKTIRIVHSMLSL